MSNLAARLDSFPEPWKPKQGDKLIGELVDVDMRASDYGDPYPILIVDAGEGSTMDSNPIVGEYAWHAFHTMARREVAKKRPQPGERVGVSYHGKGTAAPGMSPPERWRLLVDRPQQQVQPVDWDTLAPPETEGDDDDDAAASTTATAAATTADDDEIPF